MDMTLSPTVGKNCGYTNISSTALESIACRAALAVLRASGYESKSSGKIKSLLSSNSFPRAEVRTEAGALVVSLVVEMSYPTPISAITDRIRGAVTEQFDRHITQKPTRIDVHIAQLIPQAEQTMKRSLL